MAFSSLKVQHTLFYRDIMALQSGQHPYSKVLGRWEKTTN